MQILGDNLDTNAASLTINEQAVIVQNMELSECNKPTEFERKTSIRVKASKARVKYGRTEVVFPNEL